MKEITESLNVVCLMKFGSHLYGTDTPESDTDYKGIFMPTKEQVLLGKVPKSMRYDSNTSNERNSKEDVDAEMYSLHYFIELACKGETAALDMLHCDEKNLIQGSKVWADLVKFRSLFYTRNLKAFVGYARKQAAKYGLKGSRLSAAKEVLKVLASMDQTLKFGEAFSILPVNDHCLFLNTATTAVPTYQMCGKQLQSTCSVSYAGSIVWQFIESFGVRAKKAEANEGVDWKAVSHAIRAAYQVREILTDHTITYPLKEADFLKEVKLGALDFTTVVLPELENAMAVVETLSENSSLPAEVDRKFWMTYLSEAVEENLFP